MKTRLALLLSAATVALTAPAHAANLALLLDAAGEEGAEARNILADSLAAQGYEVTERAEADRDAMREAISAFAARLDEAERALLIFAGPIRAEGGHVALLPSGYDGEGFIDAAFEGVALDLLLELAGMRPGRAAVVVAHDAVGPDEEAEAIPSDDPAAEAPEAAQDWARVDVPQGVLVLAGPREPAFDAVTRRLLDPDRTADGAVDGLDDVRIYGFASPHLSFGAPAGLPEEAEAPEPRPEVVEAPEPEPAPTAEEIAAAEEEALDLDREARRRVQEDLTVLGYATRGIDGIFGPGTRGAISEWQEREGFAPTGYLTAEQLARLRETAAAQSAELAAEAERARQAEEEADAAFWRATGAAGTAPDLRAYLARHPDGIYAEEARAQLQALEAEARDDAETGDREAWEAAEAAGDIEAYRDYLAEHPEGAFAGQAEARIRELEEAPEREAVRAEAAAREEALGLSTASRALIESQLAAVGYNVGTADGSFDEDFRSALREFQARRGLEPTGYVDQATVQALIVASLGLAR
jgi:peptidoglycan hydrolase-like protein with peptidoglycan-binding domain